MFITLNADVIGSAFPRIDDVTDDILALPGLVAWFAPQASMLSLDSEGRVTSWRSMAQDALPMVARSGANRPRWTRNAAGFYGLEYTAARADVLDWAGQLPYGASAKFAAFVVATLPANGSFTYICGFDSDYAPGRNALAYNNSTARAIIVGGQPVADVSGFAPAGETLLVGYAHTENGATGRLSAYGRGTTTTVTHGAALAQGGFTLGHSAIEANRPNMIAHDVMIFDLDVLSNVSTAPAILQRYADSYRA